MVIQMGRPTAAPGREGVFARVSAPGLQQTAEVRLSALRPADSPRTAGEDVAHTRALAESDAVLPPILVHRPTMRVIDGTHRIAVARLRGADTIKVRFFDGDEASAFLLAVKSNVMQGLPLSLADRKLAAGRIVKSFPQWSDRAIGAVAGIDHKTVGVIRRRLIGEIPQPSSRIGRDGRSRPLDNADGRTRAGKLIEDDPSASVRQIARAAGISTATAQDVRKRVRSGDDPVPPRAPRKASPADSAVELTWHPQNRDRASIIQALRADPSLRFTDSGRALLRWLDVCAAPEDWEALTDRLPAHCSGLLVEIAQKFAEQWGRFAIRLEQQHGIKHRLDYR